MKSLARLGDNEVRELIRSISGASEPGASGEASAAVRSDSAIMNARLGHPADTHASVEV